MSSKNVGSASPPSSSDSQSVTRLRARDRLGPQDRYTLVRPSPHLADSWSEAWEATSPEGACLLRVISPREFTGLSSDRQAREVRAFLRESERWRGRLVARPRLRDYFWNERALCWVEAPIVGAPLASLTGELSLYEGLSLIEECLCALDLLHAERDLQLGDPLLHLNLSPQTIWRGIGGQLYLMRPLLPSLIELNGQRKLSDAEALSGEVAPELLRGRYGRSSDLYAVGMSALAAMTGMSVARVDDRLQAEQLFRTDLSAPDPVREFLERLTAFRASARFQSAREALSRLADLPPLEPFEPSHRVAFQEQNSLRGAVHTGDVSTGDMSADGVSADDTNIDDTSADDTSADGASADDINIDDTSADDTSAGQSVQAHPRAEARLETQAETRAHTRVDTEHPQFNPPPDIQSTELKSPSQIKVGAPLSISSSASETTSRGLARLAPPLDASTNIAAPIFYVGERPLGSSASARLQGETLGGDILEAIVEPERDHRLISIALLLGIGLITFWWARGEAPPHSVSPAASHSDAHSDAHSDTHSDARSSAHSDSRSSAHSASHSNSHSDPPLPSTVASTSVMRGSPLKSSESRLNVSHLPRVKGAMKHRRGSSSLGASTSGVKNSSAPQASYLGGAARGYAHPQWIQLSTGHALLGSPEGEGYESERPLHRVHIKPFAISRSEVTVLQYAQCVTVGYCSDAQLNRTDWGEATLCNWGRIERADHPLNCVSWHQAQRYAEWIGGRLPSEAEWSYAAQGGTDQARRYPWGDTEPSCQRAVIADEVKGAGCGLERTAPVCSRPAGHSLGGACDMVGNVWEWVEDEWHADYQGAPHDSAPWYNALSDERVYRGGGAFNDRDFPRIARRHKRQPEARLFNLGFRVARDVPEAKPETERTLKRPTFKSIP